MNADKIIGFFVKKGLLLDPTVKPVGHVKLNLRDVLKAADEIEPRILEVLPAALIHFPRAFKNLQALPEEFLAMVSAITRGENRATKYKGIAYKDMKRWAEKPLLDKRTKPASEKRVPRAYRFSRATLDMMGELAQRKSVSQTALLEELLREEYNRRKKTAR